MKLKLQSSNLIIEAFLSLVRLTSLLVEKLKKIESTCVENCQKSQEATPTWLLFAKRFRVSSIFSLRVNEITPLSA